MIETKERYENWLATDELKGYRPYMPMSDLRDIIEVLRTVARAAKTLMLLIEHETGLPESAANGILGPSGYPDEGIVRATKILGTAEEALDALPVWVLESEE